MKSLKIVICLVLIGFTSHSQSPAKINLANKNKDVSILADLVRTYLRATNARQFSSEELMKRDTLQRIQNNFQAVKMYPRDGYISVYYKFGPDRNGNVRLTEKEESLLACYRWRSRKTIGHHEEVIRAMWDGEIRYQYGERFYMIKKIVVKRKQ